jgi:hypothetical protein
MFLPLSRGRMHHHRRAHRMSQNGRIILQNFASPTQARRWCPASPTTKLLPKRYNGCHNENSIRGLLIGVQQGAASHWRRVPATLATISFHYDRPSSSVLYIHVVLCMYVCGDDCDVNSRHMYAYDLEEEKILHGYHTGTNVTSTLVGGRSMREINHGQSKISER